MLVSVYFLIVVTVAFAGEEYWFHQGCFEVNKFLDDSIPQTHWADCAVMARKQGSNTMGVMNDGQCLHCTDCFDTSSSNLVCPDYGSETRAQIFTLQNDSDLIPEKYQLCSRNEAIVRCVGLHPLAYRRHSDVINYTSLFHGAYRKIISILPFEQYCHVNQEGQCIWTVPPQSPDMCVSEFNYIIEASKLPVVWPPPETIPEKLISYLEGSAIPVLDFYFGGEKHAEGNVTVWSQKTVNDSFNCHRTLQNFNTEDRIGSAAVKHYGSYIANKTGVVLGSIDPWIEANMLKAGASHVITVEYKPILSLLSDITTLTPLQLASRFLADNWSPVDFAFSFSSIEHSGLGRYGDPVDGEGDLRAMRQISCLLKPGGVLFLSVPVGPDALVYNAHRIYGRHRLPVLFEGWEFLDVFGDGLDVDHFPNPARLLEPLFVLRKPL